MGPLVGLDPSQLRTIPETLAAPFRIVIYVPSYRNVTGNNAIEGEHRLMIFR